MIAVNIKGQLAMPAGVRQTPQGDAVDRGEVLGIEPGRIEGGAATSYLRDLKGMFGTRVKNVSIEAMNHAIATRGASAR